MTDAQRQQNEAAYYLALGRFVDAYARIEMIIHMVLYYYAKVTVPIGRAVFSGDRINNVQSYLRRLSDVNVINSNRWSKLNPVLDRLNKIDEIRNVVLHYGAEGVGGEKGFTTDSFMALTDDRKKVFPISADILNNLMFDCTKIMMHLMAEHTGLSDVPLHQLPQSMRGMLDASWRYIPPPPKQNRSPPDGKTKAPRRPQPPSRE